jgi:hypothetical protein
MVKITVNYQLSIMNDYLMEKAKLKRKMYINNLRIYIYILCVIILSVIIRYMIIWSDKIIE